MKDHFCLPCSSTVCAHVHAQRNCRLTPRELSVVRSLLDPALPGIKHISEALGITEGTLGIYLRHIYDKLRWVGKLRSMRLLTLWAVAHAEELGITLPSAEMFE